MLPEGNPQGSQPPTAPLLDASRPGSGQAVFGLPLPERCPRAALEAGLGGIRVWIQGGAGEESFPSGPSSSVALQSRRAGS